MNSTIGEFGVKDRPAGIRGVLGADLAGLYLYGSLASGGFDPGVSDIDLVAVTSSDIETIDLPALDRMHHHLVGRFPDWSDRVEVVYVARAALMSFRTSGGRLAVISPGEPFHVRADRLSEWLQNWYLVRETGVLLEGPDPATMIPPITWAEFAAATVDYASEIRARTGVESEAGTIAYGILTSCRALRTVLVRNPSSKREAAAWARERMPEWSWLIDAALECRKTRGTVGFADKRSRAAAQAFIRRVTDEATQHMRLLRSPESAAGSSLTKIADA